MTSRIKPIEFALPIITESNYREMLRQEEIASIKEKNRKVNLHTKQMKECLTRFVEYNILHDIILQESYGASCLHIKNRIFINLKPIHSHFNSNNSTLFFPFAGCNFEHNIIKSLTFEQKICETISHELIHIIIDEIEGSEASMKYDNIKERLRNHGYRYS